MLYLTLIYSILIISLNIYIKKKKYLSNYTGDNHQLFSNEQNIPLLGGLFLLLPIILTNYQNSFYILIFILVFLIGFFSDQKILISPKKRFLFQIAVVFLSVILLDLEIISSRVSLFDKFLSDPTFNIFFTSFCLLILINGSNFIDGLNALLLFYMTSVIFALFKLDLLNEFYINKELLIYLLIFILLIIFLNLINLLMLGDAGAYVLSFFVGYLIIKCHHSNALVSPYFFIALLWYPCFEILFSIIRKLKSNLSPLIPDNNHLHQLLYLLLKKKMIKTKHLANNLSSFMISFVNLIIILIASKDPFNSFYQIKLIFFSIFIYLFLFLFLKKKLTSKISIKQ